MKKIAVDAMGGDFAPQSVVEGVEKREINIRISDLCYLVTNRR